MIERLRAETRSLHDGVDRAFGVSDLSDRDHYRQFLAAHARALPAAERAAARAWPDLRPRLPLLLDDLADLGLSAPPPLAWETDEAGAYGALYVVEGSRLGGGMLDRTVGAGLPHRYLAAVHQPGEWRAIRTSINEYASLTYPATDRRIVSGATECFALYGCAAKILA